MWKSDDRSQVGDAQSEGNAGLVDPSSCILMTALGNSKGAVEDAAAVLLRFVANSAGSDRDHLVLSIYFRREK
jgi:hypothetical protein